MVTPEHKPPRIPPTPVVKGAFALRKRLRRTADAILPPQGLVAERTLVVAEIKMLGVACELEVPEAIDAGATTADTIAERVGARTDAVERVLRFLASRGWFVRRRDGSYQLNALSRSLRRDDPESLRDWALFMSADWAWEMWNHAVRPVQDGTSGAVAAHGKPFFEWIHEDNPEAGALFDRGMQSLSTVLGPLVTKAVGFEGVRSICDVGGGTGHLLRDLLNGAPAATGTLFDLPTVVPRAKEVLADVDRDRWSTVSGDFFAEGDIPEDHDRYVLQHILHDWGDEEDERILGNIRQAMGADSRLWVVESICDPDERDDLTKATDMLMLTVTEHGRERTQQEWERLFSAAGFRIESQIQLPLLIWVFTLAPT